MDADDNENGKYKVKITYNSAVYTRKSESSYFLGLYYLVY